MASSRYWTAALVALLLSAGAGCAERSPAPAAAPGPSFSAFVDAYLDDFARRHPSIAAGNGLHQYDSTLDNFSADAIATEIRELKATRDQLRAFQADSLTPDERVDQRILEGVIDGWLLEQETLENWKRNPMLYAAALSDGLHDLMTKEYAPAAVRLRLVISKLAGVPALLEAARVNISNPPRLLAERGAQMMRGAAGTLQNDVALAFASEHGTPLMDSLHEATAVARDLVHAYAEELERDVIPNATGEMRIGGEAVARRYRSEDLIDTPLDDMVALGDRYMREYQESFRAAAERLAPGQDALETWRTVRRDHPARGDVVAATRRVVDSLTAFVVARDLATVPDGERVVVEAAQPFALGFASMHASPPLEATPVKSFYYISDARAEQSLAEQSAWLERFNYASLAITSAHEAMPGHWLHSVYMRNTPGKVRRIWIGLNPFPQPSSGQDGWAHYTEELVVEQGFGNNDPRYEMAQLSDALTRVCRLLSGIRVHRGDWSLDDAQRCFEEEAWLATPAARREAERAVYDPTYGGYFLGKRGMLTLRRDVAAAQGDSFNLKAFHERIMGNGIAPIWAHRQLLLPGDSAPVIQ